MTERNERIFEQATAQGEPVFVIRAKDNLALGVISAYAAFARDSGCDGDFVQAVDDLGSDFLAWRAENPDLCKMPDL